MSANCDVIVIFLIYRRPGAIRKLDSRWTVYKTYIFKNSNLKKAQKIFNTALTLLLWVKVLFLPENADFLQKNAGISKIKKALW